MKLVQYDSMCRAIDACFQVDEVKDIRDKAQAMEAYAKQAQNTEAERKATEIRIRAERKAGKLLREMGRTPEENRNPVTRVSVHGEPILSEFVDAKNSAHISDTQAKRWQKLADVPDEDFERAMNGPGKRTTSGIIAKHAPPSAKKPMDEDTIWIIGRLRDFQSHSALRKNPEYHLSEMTEGMKMVIRNVAPMVIDYLDELLEKVDEEERIDGAA